MKSLEATSPASGENFQAIPIAITARQTPVRRRVPTSRLFLEFRGDLTG